MPLTDLSTPAAGLFPEFQHLELLAGQVTTHHIRLLLAQPAQINDPLPRMVPHSTVYLLAFDKMQLFAYHTTAAPALFYGATMSTSVLSAPCVIE